MQTVQQETLLLSAIKTGQQHFSFSFTKDGEVSVLWEEGKTYNTFPLASPSS